MINPRIESMVVKVFQALNQNGLTKGQEESVKAGQDKRIPAFVFVVDHGVDAVADGQGEQRHAQVLEGHPVELFRPGLLVGFPVLDDQLGQESEEGVLGVDAHVGDLGDLPHLDGEADAAADRDHGIGLVVQDVQQDDQWLKHVEKHRSDWEPF